jgi:hypothetical protein
MRYEIAMGYEAASFGGDMSARFHTVVSDCSLAVILHCNVTVLRFPCNRRERSPISTQVRRCHSRSRLRHLLLLSDRVDPAGGAPSPQPPGTACRDTSQHGSRTAPDGALSSLIVPSRSTPAVSTRGAGRSLVVTSFTEAVWPRGSSPGHR